MLADQLLELVLHGKQDQADGTLGHPRLKFECLRLLGDFLLGQFTMTSIAFTWALLDFMLHHILGHDLVIKLERILLSQFVVDLALLRLDDIGLVRVGHVGKAILVAFRKVFGKELLVLPGCLLLLHQSLGR